MRKLTNPATVSEMIIESIRKDRKTMSLNTLVFKYNVPYDFVSKVCKGISRVEKDGIAPRTAAIKDRRTLEVMI